MAQQQAFPPVGESRTVNGVVYVSDGSKFVPAPSEDLSANIRQVTPVEEPVAPERSYGDMFRSVRDTAAEFLPMAGAAIGSTFGGVPGALTGQAAGQGYRGLIQRGGELPAAIADIYRNLQSGDPDVRGATMRGFQRGADEGKINLVPGGRGSQAAVANLRAGKPYSAAADTLGALIDVGMVSGAAPIANAFTTNAPRATIGTLLGLGGSKLGGMAGDVVADETGMTPDQRVLAEAVGSTAGFPVGASLAHPKVPKIVRVVAENPVVQGAASAALTAASGAGIPAIVTAGLSPSLVNKGVRIYREGLASKERMQERGIATRERMQERGIAAKREDMAAKLESDATLLAEARADAAKNTSAKTKTDLFKLDQAHKNRLERDVLQAGTKSGQDAVKRSQKVGDVLESREYAALLADDKAAANVLESELQDALRASRDGKTEQNRQEAFARADAIRARQEKLALEKETRTRDNVLSDAAARNARKVEIAAAHTAAQLSDTHLSNVESMLKAQTPDALNATKQIADYHLELAENIDPDFRAALQGKIDQVFETQSATMAERLAAQNEQLQGLESKDIRATRSSSTVDDNNTRQRVTEVFGEPAPTKEQVPQPAAPASRPAAEPKGSAPKPKTSDKVTSDNVLEKLKEQADAEGVPVTTSLEEREIAPEMARLRELSSSRLLRSTEEARVLDSLKERAALSASEMANSYNAAGTPAGYVKVTDPVTGKVTLKLNTAGANPRRGR